MNPSKYTYFYEFADDVVISEMWQIIRTQRELRKKYKGAYDANLVKSAIAILRYYS